MLKQELMEIQFRLGTPSEREGDLDRAEMAAHRLASLLCATLLTCELEKDAQQGKQPE